jgi:uncharacterized protein (DUF983 family)
MTASGNMTISAPGDPSLRDLAPAGWPRLRTLLARAFTRRCPMCGGRGIFRDYLNLRDQCPRCGYEFAREGGYFLGAYAVNLIVAECLTVAILTILLIWTTYSWVTLEFIFIPMAIIFPLLFFPFSRSFWMAFDIYFTADNQI